MVDVNRITREILTAATTAKVVFQSPQEINALPVVSYFELATTTGACYDNAEMAQRSSIQIDVWGRSGAECADIAIKIDTAMQKGGWHRTICMDMPPETGLAVTPVNAKIYRKTMRYSTKIILNMED